MIARFRFLPFVLLFSLIAPASAAEGVFPYRCEKHVLPNGLTVLMIPMPSPGLVSYYSDRAAPAAATRSSRATRAMPTSSST